MGILKTAFWAGVIVLLLPSEPEKQRELIANASAKIDWAMTYCDRRPDMCEKAGLAWEQFLSKARFGAETVVAVARDQMARKSEHGDSEELAAYMSGRGTLEDSDLDLAWLGD